MGRGKAYGPQGVGLPEDVPRGAVAQDPAAAHDDHAVGLDDLLHAVGDVDHRNALLPEVPQDVEDPLAARRVEVGGRLVEDHIGRLHGEHAGDRHESLFPARARVGGRLASLSIPTVSRATPTPPDLRWREAEVAGPEGDILLDTHAHDLVVGVLEDHAHAPADLAVRLRVLRVEPVDEDSALLRDEQGVEVLHQGRLAAPVGADDGQVLPLGDLQVDPFQDGRPFRIVSNRQPLRLDHI